MTDSLLVPHSSCAKLMLSSRQKALLTAVIEHYVEAAEPVGSHALAGDASVLAQFGTLSTATIRNELAALEEAGLLSHPHTSAGRVPTDAGYRFYVNEMLQPRRLRASERARIAQGVPAPPSSVEDALRDATLALSRLTGYPAVATLPSERDTMRHVGLNPVPPRRLMLVLVTGANRVEHRIFEVGEDVPLSRLQTVINFLNEHLGGRTLSSLRDATFESVSAGLHDAATLQLARRAWEMAKDALADVADERIVVQGLITLLDEPEFSDIERARAAMRLFEDGRVLSELLAGVDARVLTERSHAIVIGSEHARGNPTVEKLSLVGVAYGAGGEVLGTVGVLGPTRMKYGEAVAILPHLAARLQVSLETL